MRLPILRDGWHDLPRYAPAFDKWFLATFTDLPVAQGYVRKPAQADAPNQLPHGVVSLPPHPARYGGRSQPLEKLDGTVEVDETYVGGKKIGWGVYAGKKAKEIVIGIRQRGGDLRFFHAEDTKSGTLAKYIQENVSGDVDVLVTDEFAAYPYAMKKAGMSASKHKTIEHKDRVYVRGDIHTNTVESAFSLLKRGIMGTWHRVSAKHLPAYLDEMTWRFNNRKNPFLFRDTMLKLIHSDNLEYKELTQAA